MNVIHDTLKLLDASIEEMNKKKDLTPSDLETLCKAYDLKMKLESHNTGDYGTSEGHMYFDRMPVMDYDDHYSVMRSPVTGRYISRDRMGMSGHSIKDRMIAKLEEMYDEAEGPYEREEIRKEIRQIESTK